MQKWILAGALVLSIVLGAVLFKVFTRGPSHEGVEVTWELLGQMDYISGKTSDELKSLDGAAVKIPGYMVPLEDNDKNVTEFLLVPSPQACIHVPPPPPNQMVYIKMTTPTETAYGPIWVYGRLHLTSKKHMYGESSFEMDGNAIEVYR